MDKLIEKFFNLFGVDLENSISKREATACAELTKEMMQKWDEWKLEQGWRITKRGNYGKLNYGIKTFPELLTLFLEQNK